MIRSQKVALNFNEDPESGFDNASVSSHSADSHSDDEDDMFLSDSENCFADNKRTSRTICLRYEKTSSTAKAEEDTWKNPSMSLEIGADMNCGYEAEKCFFANLLNSQSESADFDVDSHTRPEWLDEEKFKRGQKFAREHLVCINFAEMLSLFVIFAIRSAVAPLIFTGKSDTPFTAYKRYLSTLSRLISWYSNDLWNGDSNDGRDNVTLVRGMHKAVYKKLMKASESEMREKTTLGDPEKVALWCPMIKVLKQDFRETLRPRPPVDVIRFDRAGEKVWVDQAAMSITQFSFVGLAVTYPKFFGIHLASDEDLEAFVHMWRGLGYLLGVKNEYNFCNSSLSTVRKRTRFLTETLIKPSFREVTCDWEHMCRCLTEGISFYFAKVQFESTFLYLCHMLKIKTPRFSKKISFLDHFYCYLYKVMFSLFRIPFVLRYMNQLLYKAVDYGLNVPPETLQKWEHREFPYMNQPGKSKR